MTRILLALLLVLVGPVAAQTTLPIVSHDPARELCAQVDMAFVSDRTFDGCIRVPAARLGDGGVSDQVFTPGR